MTQASQTRPNPAPSVHEQVHGELRRRILSGAMAPGQAVTLRGIASELGVSITPAREAVRRLIAERALTMTPSGRVSIPLATPHVCDQLNAARALLEPELATRALPNVDKALIQSLREIDSRLDAHVANGDAAGYVRDNNAFHAALYAAADAPVLAALVESVWLQINPFMRVICGRFGTSQMADQHLAAIAALEARDEAALSRAIKTDVLQGAGLMASAQTSPTAALAPLDVALEY